MLPVQEQNNGVQVIESFNCSLAQVESIWGIYPVYSESEGKLRGLYARQSHPRNWSFLILGFPGLHRVDLVEI
jgi:hypothetical protein